MDTPKTIRIKIGTPVTLDHIVNGVTVNEHVTQDREITVTETVATKLKRLKVIFTEINSAISGSKTVKNAVENKITGD